MPRYEVEEPEPDLCNKDEAEQLTIDLYQEAVMCTQYTVSMYF